MMVDSRNSSRPVSDKISVIIPTYNRALYIADAIDSIRTQTLRPAQIIVVDDGSTDSTAEIVRRFPDIEFYQKSNGGKSSALNLGMTRVQGDFVWIFDDDDLAEPRALHRLRSALDDQRFGFAYGGYVRFKGAKAPTVNASDNGVVAEPYKDHSVEVFGLAKALMFDSFIMQPGLLVRRSCYEKVGPFNEDYVRSQDYEMMLRLAMVFEGVRVPYTCFYQRQHDGIRGTDALRLKADKVKSGWQSFDKKLLGALHRTVPLALFGECKAAGSEMTPGETISALIMRGSIMAKKHLWDLAIADFRDAFLRSASIGKADLTTYEKRALRQIFAFNNLDPGAVGSEPGFIEAIAAIQDAGLRRQVRSALLYPAPYVLRSRLQSRSFGEAAQISRAYLKVGGMVSALAALRQRLQDKRARVAF